MDGTLHVLIVSESDELGARVEHMLRSAGAVCLVSASTTPEHIAFAHRLGDLVLLVAVDDPLSRLAYLRLAGVDLPVIVLHDRSDKEHRAQLLAGGADAYERIPRSRKELMGMLEPVLDHAPRDSAPMPTGMALDPVGLTVRWQSRTATLTPREYAVLHCLLSRAGTPVSIARLQAHAWGDELPSQSASQIVTVYIHQLRRKLASVGLGQAIATVRNFGYVFAPPAGAGAGASEPTAGGASPASRPER